MTDVVDAATTQFLVHVVAAAGFGCIAYGLRVLDLPGSVLAGALAVLILQSTSWVWMLLLVCFVGAGFAVTKLFFAKKRALGVSEGKTGTRGWRNVAANGGVPAIMSSMVWLGVPEADVALGFCASIATAAADTFASELGVLSPRVFLITKPWLRVPRGTNGGVSAFGQLTALGGATVVGVVGYFLLDLDTGLAWLPVIAGFIGCQIDSVLGALFEEGRGRAYGFLSKSDVNFASQALAAFGLLLVLAYGPL